MDANPTAQATTTTAGGARTLSDMPDDELLHYGRELGLDLPRDVPRGELVRRVRDRQELLLQLDRDALLDVVVWARRPVRLDELHHLHVLLRHFWMNVSLHPGVLPNLVRRQT